MSNQQNEEIHDFPIFDNLTDLALIAEDVELLSDRDIRKQGLQELIIPTGDRLAWIDPHNTANSRQYLQELDEVYRLDGVPEAFSKLLLLGVHTESVPEDEEVYRGFFDPEIVEDFEICRNNAAVFSSLRGIGNLLFGSVKFRPDNTVLANPANQVSDLLQRSGMVRGGVNAINIAGGNIDIGKEIYRSRTAKQLKTLHRQAGKIVKGVEIVNKGKRPGIVRLSEALLEVMSGTVDIADGREPKILFHSSNEYVDPEPFQETPRIRISAERLKSEKPNIPIVYPEKDKTEILEIIAATPFSEASNKQLKSSPLQRELKSGGEIQLGKNITHCFAGFGDIAKLGLGLITKIEEAYESDTNEGVELYMSVCNEWLELAHSTLSRFQLCSGDELHELASRITVIEQLFDKNTLQVLSNPKATLNPVTKQVLRKIFQLI